MLKWIRVRPLLPRSMAMTTSTTRTGERCASCGQPTGYWAKDRLTGLPDRWGWDDLAPAVFAHALRRRRTVALLMVDIDRFKQVNDEFGHVAGDLVLQAVSS